MKLFVYLSENREQAVILFRKTKSTTLQILWDIKAGTFMEGQWLTSKSIHFKGCRLSPDGSLFMYQYTDKDGDHLCVSTPPYFTAKIYAKPVGRYCKSLFTRDNIPVLDKWVKLERADIPCVRLTEYDSLPKVIKFEGRDVHLSDTGIVQSEYQDYQNRSIITDGAILQVWGDMEKSFANAEFKNVKMIT